MIDARELTLVLLEEAKAYAGHMRFADQPDLSPVEKFSRLAESHPPPDEARIQSVIEEVFWASLLTEEGRPCRPRLLYVPRTEPMRQAVHRLAAPLPLTRESLRKLTPVQGPLGYLTWDCVDGDPKVTGVQGREGGDPSDLTIAAPNNGALDISWVCARLASLRAGSLDRLTRASLPGVHEALGIVQKLTGGFEPVFLRSAIQAIADAGHGGAIWILRVGVEADGINIGYAVRTDERPLHERHEIRSKWIGSVGNLAATDGAVLIDARVKVLGFGAFINVSEKPTKVTCYSHEGRSEQRESSKIGGGRHRSAVAFCSRFAPAAAIVVSEDGRISLIWATAPTDVGFAPLSVLAVLTDTIV
jgi:hypothetical protein